MRMFTKEFWVRATLASSDVSKQAIDAALTKSAEHLAQFMADSLAKNGEVTPDAKTTQALNQSRAFWAILIHSLRALGLGNTPSDAVALVWDFKRATGRSAGAAYLAAKAQVKLAELMAHVANGDRVGFVAGNYFNMAIILFSELLATDSIPNSDIYAVYGARWETVKARFAERVADDAARDELAKLARSYSAATASTQRSSSGNALQALGIVTNDTRARCVTVHRDSAAYQRIAALVFSE